ncbi:D-lactate dehydrogenase [Acanthocystis turfacea Chlorella virus GM0701.1]|nr:D-lactate dehydrogenase [Acanthocystis turfacea Chlorella virus GM0701.1]
MGGHDRVGQVRQAGHVAVPLGHTIVDGQIRPVGEEQPGLVLVDVHRRSCDTTCLQRLDEVRSVNETAACSVDNNRVALHGPQGHPVDEIVVLLGQRTVETEHIGVLQYVGQFVVFHTHLLDVLVLVDVVGDDATGHRLHELDELLGDLSGANHANGLASRLAADQPLEGKVPGFHTGEYQLEVAMERHHVGERELGHGSGGIRGNAVYHEA